MIVVTLLFSCLLYYVSNNKILILIHIHVPDLDGEYRRCAELRAERNDRHRSSHCEQEHGKQGTDLNSTVFPLETLSSYFLRPLKTRLSTPNLLSKRVMFLYCFVFLCFEIRLRPGHCVNRSVPSDVKHSEPPQQCIALVSVRLQ